MTQTQTSPDVPDRQPGDRRGGADLRHGDRRRDRGGPGVAPMRRTTRGRTSRSRTAPRWSAGSPSSSWSARTSWARSPPSEMGKPLSEAVGEAEFCGDIFDYFADRGPDPRRRPADQDVLRRQGRRPEAPDRAAARHHAVELPLLPDRPLRGAEPDAGQHHHPQARRVGARLRAGRRAADEGRRGARRRLRQRLRLARPDRDDHRRPAHRRRLADRLGAGRRRRRGDRRQEPEEVRARARRLRPLRHPRHRRRRRPRPTPPGRPGSATPARPATPTSG